MTPILKAGVREGRRERRAGGGGEVLAEWQPALHATAGPLAQ